MDQCGYSVKQSHRGRLLTVFVFVVLLGSLFLFFSEGKKDREDYRYRLGAYLFYDKNLSANHTKSCASCHDPQFAFTDGYRRSVTAFGENVKHNAPSLLNVAKLHFFDWANPKATTLEKQMERPLFGTHPIELGLNAHLQEVENYIKRDKRYQVLWRKAFPEDTLFFERKIIEAIACFEKKLISENSSYDAYRRGDKRALSDQQIQGMKLFFSERLGCNHCHGGNYFTNATFSENPDSVYFNIGLYNDHDSYPAEDLGLQEVTGRKEDNGKFKVPSLRNVALTAPYMHDGSVASLEEVLDIYRRGGRLYQAQEGAHHPNKDKRIKGFLITEEEKEDLILFLQSLSERR